MYDEELLRRLIHERVSTPLFVSVSGAHLYGFQSPDSDIDLRGSHLDALNDVVGLRKTTQTQDITWDEDGLEVDLVSHEAEKYLGLLVKNNGYILEQVFSPLVICGENFLEELRPIAKRCITRFHYYHYRGFFQNQRKMLAKQNTKRAKTLLYAYRVVLTGIHLMKTGEVESNLPILNEDFRLPFIEDLIAQKTEEKIEIPVDWGFHTEQYNQLEQQLTDAFTESKLPTERDFEAVNRLLIELRLNRSSA